MLLLFSTVFSTKFVLRRSHPMDSCPSEALFALLVVPVFLAPSSKVTHRRRFPRHGPRDHLKPEPNFVIAGDFVLSLRLGAREISNLQDLKLRPRKELKKSRSPIVRCGSNKEFYRSRGTVFLFAHGAIFLKCSFDKKFTGSIPRLISQGHKIKLSRVRLLIFPPLIPFWVRAPATFSLH